MQAAFQNEMEAAKFGTAVKHGPFESLPPEVQDHFHDQLRLAENEKDQARFDALIDMRVVRKGPNG